MENEARKRVIEQAGRLFYGRELSDAEVENMAVALEAISPNDPQTGGGFEQPLSSLLDKLTNPSSYTHRIPRRHYPSMFNMGLNSSFMFNTLGSGFSPSMPRFQSPKQPDEVPQGLKRTDGGSMTISECLEMSQKVIDETEAKLLAHYFWGVFLSDLLPDSAVSDEQEEKFGQWFKMARRLVGNSLRRKNIGLAYNLQPHLIYHWKTDPQKEVFSIAKAVLARDILKCPAAKTDFARRIFATWYRRAEHFGGENTFYVQQLTKRRFIEDAEAEGPIEPTEDPGEHYINGIQRNLIESLSLEEVEAIIHQYEASLVKDYLTASYWAAMVPEITDDHLLLIDSWKKAARRLIRNGLKVGDANYLNQLQGYLAYSTSFESEGDRMVKRGFAENAAEILRPLMKKFPLAKSKLEFWLSHAEQIPSIETGYLHSLIREAKTSK